MSSKDWVQLPLEPPFKTAYVRRVFFLMFGTQCAVLNGKQGATYDRLRRLQRIRLTA